VTWAIVVAVAWGVIVGGAGAGLTYLSSWYHDVLIKPSWQPPDWLFGPAWTLILALASWALYLGLRNAPGWGSRALIIGLFLLNGAANLGWSPLFFRLERPDWALYEVPLLWLSILIPALVLRPISGAASLLMVPYLCWVSFAAYLNWTIVRINPPFGA
jgi:tryptophan-rich sensory protein